MAKTDSTPTENAVASASTPGSSPSNLDPEPGARGQIPPGGKSRPTEELKQPASFLDHIFRAVALIRIYFARRRPSPGFLDSVFKAIVLVGAWLFLLGWSYLYTYYRYFGVNINSLDFPFYHYLVFSFPQFVSFGWFRTLVFLAGILTLFALTWAGMKNQSKLWAIVIMGGFLGVFWGGSYFARLNASSQATQDMGPGSSLPVIFLEFKEQKISNTSDRIEKALRPAEFLLLLENGNRFFVFKRPNDEEIIRVLEIDRGDVSRSMRVVSVK